MAKLAMYFEAVNGDKHVVRVENVKWAYQLGDDYFVEWFDERMNTWRQANIDANMYDNIDQLLTVTTQNFGDAPIVGSMKINPHAITLANNVGGLDQQILSAGQLAFTGGGGANWAISNSADAGTWATTGGVVTITGANPTVVSAASTVTSAVAVVDGETYTFGVTLNSVALGSMVAGTNFRLRLSVGATNYDLTTADLVAGNTILVNHTASSTGNINIVLTFSALTASNQSAVVIGLTAPTFRRRTGSTQLVGVLDGTLVRYEVAQQPLALLLTNGVAALVSASNTALVSFTPTGVNGGAWNGGSPAAVAFQKINIIDEISSGVAIIDLKAKSSSLLIQTSTALTSLDS